MQQPPTSVKKKIADADFVMKFPCPSGPDVFYEVKTTLEIPFRGSAEELAHRLINSLRLPFYIFDGMEYTLFCTIV
jgi:hypothetical protein